MCLTEYGLIKLPVRLFYSKIYRFLYLEDIWVHFCFLWDARTATYQINGLIRSLLISGQQVNIVMWHLVVCVVSFISPIGVEKRTVTQPHSIGMLRIIPHLFCYWFFSPRPLFTGKVVPTPEVWDRWDSIFETVTVYEIFFFFALFLQKCLTFLSL